MRRYTTTIKQSGRVIKVDGPKRKRKVKVDTDNNQFHKIKNISAREQLLAELAAAEKERKK